MSDLREAAQMALAVLVELNLEGFVLADHADPMVDAIEALRAALAEPSRAERTRAAGYMRRPTLRELPEEWPDKPATKPEPT